MVGLYKIINKVNGKFYIGSSDDIQRRFYRHGFDLLHNKHDNIRLQNAWNKHGKDSFSFEIYRECEPLILLNEEQKELDFWVGKEECYNIRRDAKSPVAIGEHRSEEIKQKISMAQKGRTRWTLEQRQQMCIDRRGRKHKPETIQKFKLRKMDDFTRQKIAETMRKVWATRNKNKSETA